MFQLYIYSNKILIPILLENGYVMGATINVELNKPKSLHLVLDLNGIDSILAKYLTHYSLQILVRYDQKQWLFTKQHNQYSHYLPVVTSNNINDIVTITNNTIFNGLYPIDYSIKTSFYGKVGYAIKNNNYKGVKKRIKLIATQNDQNNSNNNSTNLYINTVKNLNQDKSITQTLSDNILTLDMFSSLYSLDYEMINISYGFIFTGKLKQLLDLCFPSIIWNVDDNAIINNFEILIKSNTQILELLRTNMSVIDSNFNVLSNKPEITVSRLQFKKPQKLVMSKSLSDYFYKGIIPIKVENKYPSYNISFLTKEFVEEGTTIKINIFDNNTIYRDNLIIANSIKFDLLNNYAEFSTSKVLSDSSQLPRKSTLELIESKL